MTEPSQQQQQLPLVEDCDEKSPITFPKLPHSSQTESKQLEDSKYSPLIPFDADTSRPSSPNLKKMKSERRSKKLTRDDFEFLGKLGAGSYAEVNLVKFKEQRMDYPSPFYALKQVDQGKLIKKDKVETVQRERDILWESNHPNIIKLVQAFMDNTFLYFLLEYAQNRSLADILKITKTLPLELTKFYAAEIISSLEYLHQKGIVHRDLKPDNLLLDSQFHIKLTDFGESKIFKQEELDNLYEKLLSGDFQAIDESASFTGAMMGGGRGTFVGTPLYVAPEMLEMNLSGPFTDLWALGCIIFQCLTGDVPFNGNTDIQVFQLIQERKIVFPRYLSAESMDLIDKLMQKDPFQRLGAGKPGSGLDYEALQRHDFFKGISFKKLSQTSPPVPHEKFQQALLTLKQNDLQKKVKGAITVQSLEDNSSDDEELNPQPKKNIDDFLTQKLKENRPQKLLQIASTESQKLLSPARDKAKFSDDLQQMLVKTGIVYKKKGMIKSDIQLILTLTNQPRLYFMKADTKEYKSDILITQFVSATVKNKNKFEIYCSKSKKQYLLKVPDNDDAQMWVTKINSVIHAHTK